VTVVSGLPVLDRGGLGSIAVLVDGWARRTPDTVAISSVDGHRLTYAALGAQLERTRRELREAAIEAEDRVAVVHPDGPHLASAFLGIAAAAGCAPLNPSYREHELEFSLSDLGASAVVVPRGPGFAAVRAVAERLGLGILELEPFDDGGFALRTSRAAEPGRQRDDDRAQAALLLHTSGTTARPKLVPLTERNLCASASAIAHSLQLTPEDRCLAVMPLFHIHGLVATVLAPVAAGSQVVCTPGFDPPRFRGWLDLCSPTWYSAVPTMHMAALEQVRAGGGRPHGLRFVRSSSAALPVLVAEALEDVFSAPVLEAYGMTEASHQMAANPLPPDERKPGSVGRAAGPEIAVLDESGAQLEAGEIGEVAVRGPSVFAGYERNPEANLSSFTDGWFRTGDQGYLDEDGYLVLRGRLKEIINCGGEKVSPGEVEEALRAHPDVADAVAFAQAHVRLGETVAAAVVPSNDVSPQELREFASSRLAPFKVPATVVVLNELPKGPTGKVQRIGLADRLGLPTLGDDDSGRPPYAPPRTDLESRLCEIWSELLGVEQVGIHDDFIALGGDSLLVAQLFAQVSEERGGEDIPASAILAAPTVEQLAGLLERGWSGDGGALQVEPGRTGTPFFFVPAHDWGTVGLGTLGRRLEGARALYTFQLDDDLTPEDVPDVAAVAARLVPQLRATQPHGPYVLGGICFGGGVALEMARLLASEGEQVTLLLVNPIGERPGRVRHAARSAGFNLRNRSFLRWLRRRGRPRAANDSAPPVRRRARALEQALRAASGAYRAHPYSGPVTVLAGKDYTTPRRFWERVATGGLVWRPIPHGSAAVFRTRHLAALAEALDAALAEA
jgi:acyl-CoA synthetase (AMP-forming)/AMP-acid ligase II/thioesterase domain-containing protein